MQTENAGVVKDLIISMAREIVHLEDEVSSSSVSSNSMLDEIGNLEKVIEDLRAKLTESENKRASLNANNEALRQDLDFWKVKHTASPDTLNLLEANKKLIQELESLRITNESLNEELDELYHPEDCKCGICF